MILVSGGDGAAHTPFFSQPVLSWDGPFLLCLEERLFQDLRGEEDSALLRSLGTRQRCAGEWSSALGGGAAGCECGGV